MLLAGKKPVVEFVAPEVGSRTPTQNASMHKWFELVADTLNNAGLDMKRVLKPDVDIPWTKTSVKEFIWRPIQEAMFDKESTTEANKVEYGEIEEVIRRHLAQKHGVSLPPWPTRKEGEQDE